MMNPEIVVGGLSLVGTLAGTFGGIMTSNRLTGYRLEQLEKRVEQHNNLISRMYRCEEAVAIHDEKIEEAERRIDKIVGRLEREHV